MSIFRHSDGSPKVIGATTLSTVGGAQAGLLVAILVTEVLGLELSIEATQGLACLLALAGMLIGGYLSPSKAAEARHIIDEYKAELESAQPVTEPMVTEPVTPKRYGPDVVLPYTPIEVQAHPDAMTVSMGHKGTQEAPF